MTEKFELYKCETCGNLIEVLIPGNGELVCCGQPMKLLTAHTEEEIKGEYHLPVVYKNENGINVIQVGKKSHPMLSEHYIQFIQAISEDGKTAFIKFLSAGEQPELPLDLNLGKFIAREHCNIHGLWARVK